MCVTFSNFLLKVSKTFCHQALEAEDVQLDVNSDVMPIVTKNVKRAVNNVLKKTVLESLWDTQFHTKEYKAGTYYSCLSDSTQHLN